MKEDKWTDVMDSLDLALKAARSLPLCQCEMGVNGTGTRCPSCTIHFALLAAKDYLEELP